MNAYKKTPKWFLVLPPQGAARSVFQSLVVEFSDLVGKMNCVLFDCQSAEQFLGSSLAHPLTSHPDLHTDFLNHLLVVQALDQECTHLLAGALAPISLFSLKLLQKYGVHNSLWFYEDYQRVGYYQEVLQGYNNFFAIQQGKLPQECLYQGTNYHYLPVATQLASPTPSLNFSHQARTIPCLFLGVPSPYRIEVLEYIYQAGIPIKIAGAGWASYQGILKNQILLDVWTPPDRAQYLFEQSLACLNLSYNNPGTQRSLPQTSPRAFDALAAGCELITEETELIFSDLKNMDFFTFTEKEQLPNLIKQSIANFDLRETQHLKNRKEIFEGHTYRHRALSILNKITPPANFYP